MKDMKVIYEHEEGDLLPEGYIDGMQSVIDEYDFHSTEWIVGVENPPMGFWQGTHTRDGKRIKGCTDAQYIRGEASGGTIQRDAQGKPIYA